MSYDVEVLRQSFPSLAGGNAYFDGPGGTQTPTAVGTAIAATLTAPLSNRGTQNEAERNADAAVADFRQAMADFTGSEPDGVVFGRSATQLIYDFADHLSRRWGTGDEIVVSRLDHDANVRPWVQAAERVGATVRWADFDPETTEFDLDGLADVLTAQTRLVAVTGASNLVGTQPPLAEISARAHEVGALVHVDAVHLAAHELLDRRAWGVDLLTCSPYKFLGPHCGVLAGDPALLETIAADKLAPATNVVPERFEYGTLPYETMAGVTAAVDFIAAIAPGDRTTRRQHLQASWAAIHEHEIALRARIEAALVDLGDAVVLHSRAAQRTPTLLVTVAGRDTAALSAQLADRGVFAPSGTFYAYEPARRLGLTDGGLRIGLAPYTTVDDVERLLAGLADFLAR